MNKYTEIDNFYAAAAAQGEEVWTSRGTEYLEGYDITFAAGSNRLTVYFEFGE